MVEEGKIEMPVDNKDLFLIDGFALIYRSYYAFFKNQLRTRSGEYTGAIFGFTSFLLRILDRYIPQYWAVVLDTQEPTFRHKLFPDYKATREKMPEELQEQLPRIREIMQVFHIPVLELEGYEADDIIGTLSRRGVHKGLRVVIVSGDKDFCQLVRDDVFLLNPGKKDRPDDWMNARGVIDKMGVPPDKVVDMLALMGDSSDNVPGVPGIGRKTAEKLIKEFGGLSELFESLPSVSSARMREKLETHREEAFLSRDLVTLDADIPVEISIDSLKRVEPDREKMDILFKDLEFYSLIKERNEDVKVEEKGVYRTVTSRQDLESILKRARDSGRLGLDVETTALDPMEAELVGISLSVKDGEAYYIPLAHTDERPLDKDKALDALRPVLESREIEKIGQNLKYDLVVLRRAGIELDGLSFDTMIASYLLEPERKSHGLDFLAREFLGLQMTSFSEVVTGDRVTFANVPIELAKEYSCEDIDFTFRLADLFKGMLERKKLYPLFRDVEIPLISVLADMEMTGVSIDNAFFEGLSRRLERDLKHLEDDIYTIAGEEFNINSHQQLSRILFEKLKLPKQKKTKTGYSTDSEVLARLAEQHEIPERLLGYRELSKLKNTYVDSLPAQVNQRTGRIHTSYNQVVTSTGRLSSSRPNLQNIPVRTDVGREIRRGFVPEGTDRLILSCDYSQIELRIMAHLSRDKEMTRAFEEDEDIHRQTAALVFDIPYDKVPDMLRSRAKEVNFGVIYGMGAFGLSRRLGIPMEEANAFIDGYFQRFSGVKSFIDKTISETKELGYVTTIMGRRRYLPDIDDSRRSVREFAQRNAINSPIQGSAADIIKVAMIDVHRELRRRDLKSRMIIQVHDELVFEVFKDELEEVKAMVREKMEQAIVLKVPILVDLKVGSNWLECKGG